MAENPSDDIANNPRVGLLRFVLEFLLQQNSFGSSAMMVAEHISHIHYVEKAESFGNLCIESVRTASATWQTEVHGFKYWFGTPGDNTIARLMQELADKGMQQFVANLAVELQIDHMPEGEIV